MKFNHANYEEFLSSGTKSPRVARQYRRVSSEIRSQVSSKTSPKMARPNSAIYGRVARVNISHETREANVVEGQSCNVPPLNIPQLQVTGGAQQPMKHKWNAERRQRRRARQQQMKKAGKIIVQQIQDVMLRPASFLNCIRRAKSASGYQNAELKRLAFLRPYFTDAMFSNARSVSFLRDTRLASL